MLFSSARAMASWAVRYNLPPRIRACSRSESDRRTVGTSTASYGLNRIDAAGLTGPIEVDASCASTGEAGKMTHSAIATPERQRFDHPEERLLIVSPPEPT